MSEAMNSSQKFYGDLAHWWPLISPVAEYKEEAAFLASLLETATISVREVLEIGSGGGHLASHLTERYELTLVDLSPQMLTVSRQLNPACEHHLGDMRSLRLEREFDAVFIHDAVEYMTRLADLERALHTAYLHCRVGGIAVFVPDSTKETFQPSTDCGGSDASDGRGARYLEWTFDPDPHDDTIQCEYAFALRDSSGKTAIVHETHVLGLFSHEVWVTTLERVGFAASSVAEATEDDRAPRTYFIGRRLG